MAIFQFISKRFASRIIIGTRLTPNMHLRCKRITTRFQHTLTPSLVPKFKKLKVTSKTQCIRFTTKPANINSFTNGNYNFSFQTVHIHRASSSMLTSRPLRCINKSTNAFKFGLRTQRRFCNNINTNSNNRLQHIHGHGKNGKQTGGKTITIWNRMGFYSGGLFAGVAVSGIFGGLVGGLGGTGGALVMLPLLRQFTRLTVHQLAGATMAAVTGGTFVATMSYIQQKNGMIVYPIAITISISSVIGCIAGVKMAKYISSRVLTLLTSWMLFVGIYPIYNKQKQTKQKRIELEQRLQAQGKSSSDHDHNHKILNMKKNKNKNINSNTLNNESLAVFYENPLKWLQSGNNYQYIAVGTVGGFLSGMLGLGGGIVMIAYLTAYGNNGELKLTQHQMIATSIACTMPQGLTVGLLHGLSGNVKVPIMVALACANATGMFVASRTSVYIDERYLQIGLCAMLFASSFKMAQNAFTMFRLAAKNAK